MSDSKKGDATPKKASLIDRILAILKLDDSGNLYSFFAREIAAKEKQIKFINNNLKTRVLKHELELENLNDKIADAKADVEEALMNVDVELIKSNADKDKYSIIYWNAIEVVDEKLTVLIKERTEIITAYEDANKLAEIKIADIKKWISRITN